MSVRKVLNVLKEMLNLAAEWDMILMSPAHGVKLSKLPPGFRIGYYWLIAGCQTPAYLPPRRARVVRQ